ncbi:MAG: hypothetical protein VKI83_02725 [Synechococcaceae cyanobacterium]|nr:hypothetical protein [Synechococcaceae cyanobacterium]
MADPGPDSFSSRYTEIDKAYRDQRWATVLEQGELLLRELANAGDSRLPGLRERIQLLMAHAHLYGYGDPEAAEDLYGAVLTSKAETSLRQIAEQGLQRCELPLERRPGEKAAGERRARVVARPRSTDTAPIAEAARPVPVAPELEAPDQDNAEAQPAAAAPAAAPAAGLPAFLMPPAGTPKETPAEQAAAGSAQPALPWLQSSAAAAVAAAAAAAAGPAAVAPAAMASPAASEAPAAALVPDVVEEPELIEVHQADPLLAEELELEVNAPVSDITRAAPRVKPRPIARIEEDPDLMAGLLEVTLD